MSKTIIAVCGEGSVGKTSSIRLAYEKLKPEARILNKGKGWKDVKGGILLIEGEKVGFASQGDYSTLLKPTLDELIEAGCTIIVCATRPSGTPVHRVVESLIPEFESRWIIKRPVSSAHYDQANQATADEIIGHVRAALEANLVEA